MANLEPLMTSKSQSWLTPLWLFDLLDSEFNFDLDPCATDENTLCDNWYTEEQNGLIQPWRGNAFVNFPYSDAALWVKKAYEEAKSGNCTAVLLMPSRTDTRYFWNYCRYGEIRLLPGRLKFENEEGTKNSAPFPSCLTIFHRDMAEEPKVIFWEVREKK